MEDEEHTQLAKFCATLLKTNTESAEESASSVIASRQAARQPFLEPINLRGSFVISINLSLLMQHKIIYEKLLPLGDLPYFFLSLFFL